LLEEVVVVMAMVLQEAEVVQVVIVTHITMKHQVVIALLKML
jgi:hypothetical protein